jgi:hypothetical protein
MSWIFVIFCGQAGFGSVRQIFFACLTECQARVFNFRKDYTQFTRMIIRCMIQAVVWSLWYSSLSLIRPPFCNEKGVAYLEEDNLLVFSNGVHLKSGQIRRVTFGEWVSECCLRQPSNFSAISWLEQVNFAWNEDEIHFVVDQHAQLDFIVLFHWNNSPWLDMSPHSDTLSWLRAN